MTYTPHIRFHLSTLLDWELSSQYMLFSHIQTIASALLIPSHKRKNKNKGCCSHSPNPQLLLPPHPCWRFPVLQCVAWCAPSSCVSNKLTFQWQPCLDLLASSYLNNNNKTCILKHVAPPYSVCWKHKHMNPSFAENNLFFMPILRDVLLLLLPNPPKIQLCFNTIPYFSGRVETLFWTPEVQY